MIYLKNPLSWKIVTQPFGVNYVDFYRKMGMGGHNGIDYRAVTGTPCYACFEGEIIICRIDRTGGKEIRIKSKYKTDKGVHYEAVYYHLSGFEVKKGDIVQSGQKIGYTGNTGKYTTFEHLHFGLKKILYRNGKRVKVLDYNNSFYGSIDPQPYFEDGHIEYLPVDDYYERKRSWITEFKLRFKNFWLHRYLIKIGRKSDSLTDRETKALIYGGWGVDDVFNPAMFSIWATLKKDDYKKGKEVPIRV